MQKRIEGFDFVRTVAILMVFLGHILNSQATNPSVLLVVHALSPGLTMSLLGFISAVLLSSRQSDAGTFLIRRFSRIYVSLWLCLLLVLIAHAILGKAILSQHLLLHLMGLSAFFEVLGVANKATVGDGLWFITAITSMYLLLPVLQKILHHRRGLLHLIGLVGICTALNLVMYGTTSIWTVVISFSVGVYVGVNGYTERVVNARLLPSLVGAVCLMALMVMALSGIVPLQTQRLLFAFYPLAFIPLLFALATRLPPPMATASRFFAGISYEFYILHFYVINTGYLDFFPPALLSVQMATSFAVTLVTAYLIAQLATVIRHHVEAYLLPTNT